MNLANIGQSLIDGKADEVTKLVNQALSEGIGVKEVLDKGLIAGMDVVGARFKNCEIFLPEVLVAARAMKAGMEILKPMLAQISDSYLGKVIIGTVQGDIHDIGKNIVAIMLEGAGFQIIDLGVDVSATVYAQKVAEHKPQIVGLSALLTTTMIGMRNVVETLKEHGMRDKVRVIVGGAPLTDKFAKEIGADGYAPDAPSAVQVCKGWLN